MRTYVTVAAALVMSLATFDEAFARYCFSVPEIGGNSGISAIAFLASFVAIIYSKSRATRS